jgi:hypothetical protein
MAVAPFESVWHVQFYGAALKHWAASGGATSGDFSSSSGDGGRSSSSNSSSSSSNSSNGNGNGKGVNLRPALACTLFSSLALRPNRAHAEAAEP